MNKQTTEHQPIDINTAMKKNAKPDLSPQQINDFQRELDELRHSIESKLGKEDVDYLRQVIEIQRYLEISGRLLIHFSLEPVSWALGVASLSAAHILENMEIGHNVIHGQYDFMNDEKYNSEYEWTMTGTAKNWRRAHNHHHHAYTNVIGKDTDYGFGMYRLSEDVKWKPLHLFQTGFNVLNALAFEYSVSLYDLQITQYILPKWLRQEEHAELLPVPELLLELKEFAVKSSKKGAKEYLFYPLLAGPLAPKVLVGNLSAQVIRNIWAFSVIYCGHLPDGNFTFTEQEMEAETKGQWYLRQILGSSNFEGGLLTHIMSGHLSHQIEHHLYPDLPAWRYRELGPKVEDICSRYGVPYAKGKMVPMLGTVARRLAVHSLPEQVVEKLPKFGTLKKGLGKLLTRNKQSDQATAEVKAITKAASTKAKLSAA